MRLGDDIGSTLGSVQLPMLSPQTYRRITIWALWALVLIIVTGGAVRLTGSGLGCSDWPTCEQDRLIAPLEFHALIEFVNRLFTGVVSAAVIAATLGSLRRRPRRPDLTRWSWGLVAGVIAQILLGALLVMSELDPRFTIGHFLLSMVLVWNAMVLVHRASLADNTLELEPATPAAAGRKHSRALVAMATVVLVTGTVVTGSGPHGGDDGAARFDFAIATVARIHGITVVTFLAAALLLRWRLYRTPGGSDTRKAADRLLIVIAAQTAVGYTQYLTGIPAFLVGIHLLGAAVVWIAVLDLHLTLTDRRPKISPRLTAAPSAVDLADGAVDHRQAPILSSS